MAGTSILTLDTTLEIRNSSQLLGYVHTSAKNSATGADPDEAEQVQRWYLLCTDFDEFFPNSTCVIQQPADSAWRIGDRSTFIEKVRKSWTPSKQLYAKANCASYTPGDALSLFTRPKFLLKGSALLGSQGDIGTAQIRNDRSGTLLGYVYTEEYATGQRYEYWALHPDFGTVDSTDESTFVSLGLPITFTDRQQFATLMFQGGLPMTGSSFWCLAVQYFDKVPGSATGQDW